MDGEKNRLSLLSLQDERDSFEMASRARETYEGLREFLNTEYKLKARNRSITIIGGGIVGLMAAFFLQKGRFNVTILEKKSFGAAASGRNGGGVLALGRDLAEIPYARLAGEIWHSLESEGIDTHYIRSGHVMFARNKYEKEKLLKACDIYNASGLDVKMLSTNELTNMIPKLNPQINMGLFSKMDGQSYPFAAINGLLHYLKENGAVVVKNCEVLGFKTSGQTIDYAITNKGDFASDAYLFCAGPWTTELCKMINEDILIRPRRSQILVTEILRKREINPFLTGNSLYLRQTHAGNILFGGGGTWEINGFDVSNTNFAIEFLSKRLIEIFPEYKNKQLMRAFAGTVELTKDHLPYFGKINKWENAFISAGYNGHGYGMSTVMGKIMAHSLCCLLEGQGNPVEEILSRFSVERLSQEIGEYYV